MASEILFNNSIANALGSQIPLKQKEVSILAKDIHKANTEMLQLDVRELKYRVCFLGKISKEKLLPARIFRWHFLTFGISYLFMQGIKQYDKYKANVILKEKQELIEKYLAQMLESVEPSEKNITMLRDMLKYVNQESTKKIYNYALQQKEMLIRRENPIGNSPEILRQMVETQKNLLNTLQNIAAAKLKEELAGSMGKAVTHLRTLSAIHEIQSWTPSIKESLTSLASSIRATKGFKNKIIANQIEHLSNVLSINEVFTILVKPLLENIPTERTMQSSVDLVFTKVTTFLEYVQDLNGNQGRENANACFQKHFHSKSLNALKKQGMQTIVSSVLKSISIVEHSKGAALRGPLPISIPLVISILDKLPDWMKQPYIESFVEDGYRSLEPVLISKLEPVLGLVETRADAQACIETLFWWIVPNLLNQVLSSIDGSQKGLNLALEGNVSWDRLVDQFMDTIRGMQFKQNASIGTMPEVRDALAAMPTWVFQNQRASRTLLLQPSKKWIEDSSSAYCAGQDVYEVASSVLKRASPMPYLSGIAAELLGIINR